MHVTVVPKLGLAGWLPPISRRHNCWIDLDYAVPYALRCDDLNNPVGREQLVMVVFGNAKEEVRLSSVPIKAQRGRQERQRPLNLVMYR